MADQAISARLLLLAIVAGTAMASNYVLQPVLPAVAQSFPASPWIASLAAGAGPLGYMLGLVLLVPLGDGLSVRTLVTLQAAALAAMLAVAAATTVEPLFLVALLLGGMAQRITAVPTHAEQDDVGSEVPAFERQTHVSVSVIRCLRGAGSHCHRGFSTEPIRTTDIEDAN